MDVLPPATIVTRTAGGQIVMRCAGSDERAAAATSPIAS